MKEWAFEYKVTIPYAITSMNEGNGMPASVKRRLELHSKQFAGVPIISKCKKYSTSHMKGKPKVCVNNIDTGAFAKMVTESLLSADSEDQLFRTCNFKDSSGKKKTTVKRTPDYWPKDAQGVQCCHTPLGERSCDPACLDRHVIHLSVFVYMHVSIHTVQKERGKKREMSRESCLKLLLVLVQISHLLCLSGVQIASVDGSYPGAQSFMELKYLVRMWVH